MILIIVLFINIITSGKLEALFISSSLLRLFLFDNKAAFTAGNTTLIRIRHEYISPHERPRIASMGLKYGTKVSFFDHLVETGANYIATRYYCIFFLFFLHVAEIL